MNTSTDILLGLEVDTEKCSRMRTDVSTPVMPNEAKPKAIVTSALDRITYFANSQNK